MKLLGSTPSIPGGRSIELDFVRGIAILAVMGYHFHTLDTGNALVAAIEYPLKSFGREGVNLFFTLSGFLVGGLLLRQYAEKGHVDAGRFIVRRIFKIWPAYYVLILFHVLARRHPYDTFLWQNLTHSQNYYGSSIAQTWSLAVEEHFYLFLPAVLMLFAHWKMKPNAIIGALSALCGIVLIGRCMEVYGGNLEAAFFYTQYRIDSLLFGVILAAVYWMKPDTYRWLARQTGLLLFAVAVLVGWLVFGIKHDVADESIGYTIQAIGFCAFIILTLEHSVKVRGSLLYRGMAWLGVYSYGIYLWHSIALAPGDMIIHKATALGLPKIVIWVLALGGQGVVAVVAGYAMTRIVEYPFLRLRNALFPDRRRAVTIEPVTESVAAAAVVEGVAAAASGGGDGVTVVRSAVGG